MSTKNLIFHKLQCEVHYFFKYVAQCSETYTAQQIQALI